MTRLVLLLATLFFVALPVSYAEVLIYTGTIRRTEPEDSYKAYPLKCFIVTNPVTSQVAVIGYGKVKGLKRRDDGTIEPADYYPLVRADQTKFDLYAYTFVDKAVGVINKALFLRGAQRTVNVNRVS